MLFPHYQASVWKHTGQTFGSNPPAPPAKVRAQDALSNDIKLRTVTLELMGAGRA